MVLKNTFVFVSILNFFQWWNLVTISMDFQWYLKSIQYRFLDLIWSSIWIFVCIFLQFVRFNLSYRRTNMAIILLAVFPVTNYLPRWGAMRRWTWFSRHTWCHMNEHILRCLAMGQRALGEKRENHVTFLISFSIKDGSFVRTIRTQF